MPNIHTYVKVSSTCAKLRPAISQDKSNPPLCKHHFENLNLEPPAIPLLLWQCSGQALHFNYLPHSSSSPSSPPSSSFLLPSFSHPLRDSSAQEAFPGFSLGRRLLCPFLSLQFHHQIKSKALHTKADT